MRTIYTLCLLMAYVQSLRALHKSSVSTSSVFLSVISQDHNTLIQCTIRPIQNNLHHMLLKYDWRHLADRSACCDQFIIGSPLGHEFIMRALFYDSSMRHHCYDVSGLDSRQPVSDDDAGSSFSRLIQGSLDRLQKTELCQERTLQISSVGVS